MGIEWDYVGIWSRPHREKREDYSLILLTGDFPNRGIIRGLAYDEKGWSRFSGAKTDEIISFTQKYHDGEKRAYQGKKEDGFLRGEWESEHDGGIFTLVEEISCMRSDDHLARMFLGSGLNELKRKANG